MKLSDVILGICPEFVRNFIAFHSNRKGVMQIYYYLSSFFWTFFFASACAIVVMMYIGYKHYRRSNRVHAKQYDRSLKKILSARPRNDSED